MLMDDWKHEQELEKKIQRAKLTSILDASGFALKKFPLIMSSVMEKTIVMKMCNNKLSTVPKDIKGFTYLTSLDLGNNCICDFPQSLSFIPQLEFLNMNNNQLQAIPSWIGELRNLTSLFFSNNQITFIPEEIGNLTKLQKLYLNKNKLSMLPRGFCKLKELEILQLYGNNFDSTLSEMIEGSSASDEYFIQCIFCYIEWYYTQNSTDPSHKTGHKSNSRGPSSEHSSQNIDININMNINVKQTFQAYDLLKISEEFQKVTSENSKLKRQIQELQYKRSRDLSQVKAVINENQQLQQTVSNLIEQHQLLHVLKEDQELKHNCLVCYEHEKDVVLRPCNHMVYCRKCYLNHIQDKNVGNPNCPICRTPVKEVLNVFL